MKRSLSDSEDDQFDDSLNATSPSQSCHITDRKKRRGVIEKRRRDRINTSLSELRRLVPTAFEKQGSAKLEKAEILQMTVDHLKILNQKGVTGYNYPDPHALAMDYRSVGFRECAAEVARYLVTMEGMDIQDPLRLRLMSHLQCFSAQREAAAKVSLQNTSVWNGAGHNQLNSGYNMNTLNHNTNMSSLPMLPSASQADCHTSHTQLGGLAGLQPVSCHSNNSLSHTVDHISNHGTTMGNLSTHHINGRLPPPNVPTQFSTVSSSACPPLQQVSGQLSMSFPMLSPTTPHSYSPSHASSMPTTVKPYRPWGSEMTY